MTERSGHVFQEFWQAFRQLPSAWLLLVQCAMLLLAGVDSTSHAYRTWVWALGVLALLLVAKVIRQTPVYTVIGLFFVLGALVFSMLIFVGYQSTALQVLTHFFESMAYFCAVYGLVRYMFADRYLTKDELFAAAAVFTLMAWGFAFLYQACQLIWVGSFSGVASQELQSWLDLLFLSFSLQSATGLSDILPVSTPARILAMLQMFAGVMYLALIVSRLIALQYIAYRPQVTESKSKAEPKQDENP